MLQIDPSAVVFALVDIEGPVRGTKIEIGRDCLIDSFVKFKPTGGACNIVPGERVYINSGCVLYSGDGITIGNNVSIAANCAFAPTNHTISNRDIPIQDQGFLAIKGGIIVGDDVRIGVNCVLLDVANIGDGVIIAAGGVVRGVLDACGIYTKSPLSKISERT